MLLPEPCAAVLVAARLTNTMTMFMLKPITTSPTVEILANNIVSLLELFRNSRLFKDSIPKFRTFIFIYTSDDKLMSEKP